MTPPSQAREALVLLGIFGFLAGGLALSAATGGFGHDAEKARLARARAECEASGRVVVELRQGRHGQVYDRLCIEGGRIAR